MIEMRREEHAVPGGDPEDRHEAHVAPDREDPAGEPHRGDAPHEREGQVREDEPREPRAPEPEKTAEYVFVRSDGSLVFAVGYSWDKDILRYVTRDGVRRTIKREALDLNATQEFNEQRGLSFHLG